MKKNIIALFLCINLSVAYSQMDQQLIPSLRFSTTYTPPNHYSDKTGYYKNLSEELSFRSPVIKKINPDNHNIFALLVNANVGYEQPYFSVFSEQHQFIKAGAGLSTMFHFKTKNTLIISAKTSFSEDEQTINYPSYRLSGSIIYTRRSSNKFSLVLGAISSYNYSKTRVFPIVGMRIKPTQKVRLSIIFPANLNFEYRPVKKFSVTVGLSPKGEQARFSSMGMDTSSGPLYLKIRRINASMTLKFIASRQFDIGLQGGVMVLNKLSIVTPDQTITNSLDPGMFLKLSINYRFHKKKKAIITADDLDIEEDDEILDQLNIDDILNY